MSKDILAGRRRPEALHTNHCTLVARPTMPSYRRTGFHRDAFLDASRKDAFTVRILLGLEQAPTRHTDYARLHTQSLQLLPRQHTEIHFRARTDEDHIGRTTFGLREHIGTVGDTRVLSRAAVKMRDDLPREH